MFKHVNLVMVMSKMAERAIEESQRINGPHLANNLPEMSAVAGCYDNAYINDIPRGHRAFVVGAFKGSLYEALHGTALLLSMGKLEPSYKIDVSRLG